MTRTSSGQRGEERRRRDQVEACVTGVVCELLDAVAGARCPRQKVIQRHTLGTHRVLGIPARGVGRRAGLLALETEELDVSLQALADYVSQVLTGVPMTQLADAVIATGSAPLMRRFAVAAEGFDTTEVEHAALLVEVMES